MARKSRRASSSSEMMHEQRTIFPGMRGRKGRREPVLSHRIVILLSGVPPSQPAYVGALIPQGARPTTAHPSSPREGCASGDPASVHHATLLRFWTPKTRPRPPTMHVDQGAPHFRLLPPLLALRLESGREGTAAAGPSPCNIHSSRLDCPRGQRLHRHSTSQASHKPSFNIPSHQDEPYLGLFAMVSTPCIFLPTFH